MNFGRPSPQSGATKFTSKFIGVYSKLFQGVPPSQIAPGQDHDRFFADLLDLNVDHIYLEGELNRVSKDACLGRLKPFLSTLFKSCIKHSRRAPYEDVKKGHSIETLLILVSRVLAKNLTGREIMDVLTGSVAQSDTTFSEFTEILDTTMGDAHAPVSLRQQILQLALTYMCGVAQLSVGAYFLRRDFFPSIVAVTKSPEMEQYTFEAILFLSILGNYHKSDAAKLNPYLKRIRETSDGDFMRKLCWAANFTLQTAIRAYQEISDDSVAAPLTLSFGSVMTRLRPDRVLALAPLGTPKDKFKDQPIEASVVLLPVYEFLRLNPVFTSVLFEDLVSPPTDADVDHPIPLPCTLISFASYLCTHASSTSSPRSIAYAGLSLDIILALVENNLVMGFMTQPEIPSIRLCRQRLPALPPPRILQAPICSVLDCCTMWLRHNLHRRLEVQSYTKCIWICYRIVWFLQNRRIRLGYDWMELWNSIIGLLSFLSAKTDALNTTGGVELLASETIRLLDFALCASELYLPTPRALHELIYELVRSSSVFRKQAELLKSLELPYPSKVKPSYGNAPIEEVLAHIMAIADFYEEKITEKGAGVGNAHESVMKIVADEIEANGLHGTTELRETTPVTRSQDVLDFARFACGDILVLMP